MSGLDLFKLLAPISALSGGVAVITGFFRIRKLGRAALWIWSLCIVILGTEQYNRIQTINQAPTHIASNVFTLLQVLFLGAIFWCFLTTKGFRLIGLIIWALCLFFTVYSFWVGPGVLTSLNTHAMLYSQIGLGTLCFIIFWKLLMQKELSPLMGLPDFWVSVGVLLYASSSIVNFYALPIVQASSIELFAWLAVLNIIFNILKNLSLAYALWITPKR